MDLNLCPTIQIYYNTDLGDCICQANLRIINNYGTVVDFSKELIGRHNKEGRIFQSELFHLSTHQIDFNTSNHTMFITLRAEAENPERFSPFMGPILHESGVCA